MGRVTLSPAENLRLQQHYLPDLIKYFETPAEKKAAKAAGAFEPPRERWVLCESPVGLLEQEKLAVFPAGSAEWNSIKQLDPQSIRLLPKPGPTRAEEKIDGLTISGDGCWLQSQFPVVLVASVPLQKSRLAKAAAIYAVRPLGPLDRRRLAQAQAEDRVIETTPEQLSKRLVSERCRYTPAVLFGKAQRRRPSSASLPWDATVIPADFQQTYADLSRPRSAKLWASDLLNYAQGQFETVFFQNLDNELRSSKEGVELCFTKSYIAVSLFGEAKANFSKAVAARASGYAQRLVSAKGNVELERHNQLSEYMEYLGREIKQRIPALQRTIWKKWEELEWWE